MRAFAVGLLSVCLFATVFTTIDASAQTGTRTYPPLSEYLMPRDAEIALARSAAPEAISSRASVKVLTASGFEMAATGDNGFTCLVLRGWSAPTFSPLKMREIVYNAKLRAPICYDPVASRTILPMQELRTKLAIEKKDPDTISREVASAYTRGALPKMESVAFGYMWSAKQYLGEAIGAWHPHMMVYSPYYTNAMLGGNAPAGTAPFVSEDEGTPYAIVVVAVHGNEPIGGGSHDD